MIEILSLLHTLSSSPQIRCATSGSAWSVHMGQSSLVVFHLVSSLGSVTVNLDYQVGVPMRKGSTAKKKGIQPGLHSEFQ